MKTQVHYLSPCKCLLKLITTKPCDVQLYGHAVIHPKYWGNQPMLHELQIDSTHVTTDLFERVKKLCNETP